MSSGPLPRPAVTTTAVDANHVPMTPVTIPAPVPTSPTATPDAPTQKPRLMKMVDEYKQPDSILLVGEPGTGKSTLAMQFPGLFVLDCDVNQRGPIEWLKRAGKFKPFHIGSPLLDEEGNKVPRLMQYRRAAELLNEAGNSPDIKTIFIDSATTFCDIVLTEVMRQQGRKLGDIYSQSQTIKTVDEQLQQQDWGQFYGLMKRIIFDLKATGKTIILAAHIRTNQDATGTIEKGIAIQGQTGDLIAGWFGEVWKITRTLEGVGASAKEKRMIVIQPAGKSEVGLGLKSSCGIPTNTPIDSDVILQKLFG